MEKNQESFDKKTILGSNEMFNSNQRTSKKRFKQIAGRKGKSYAPLNGDGECYKLGSSSICHEYGAQSRFVVDQNIHVPKCSSGNSQLQLINGRLTCNINDKGECKPSVHIAKDKAASHIRKILNQR